MSCLVRECCRTACECACKDACKDAHPYVAASLLLAISITLLVIGILGACSVMKMTPAAAYLSIGLGTLLAVVSCFGFIQGKKGHQG